MSRSRYGVCQGLHSVFAIIYSDGEVSMQDEASDKQEVEEINKWRSWDKFLGEFQSSSDKRVFKNRSDEPGDGP